MAEICAERDRIKAVVEEIGVPCMLNGSGVMVMHGMPREPEDLDFFVPTEYWFALYHQPKWQLMVIEADDEERLFDPPFLSRSIEGIVVDVFSSWRVRMRGNINLNEEWQRSEIVDGVRCLALTRLYEWKKEMLRSKDMRDVDLIDAHLNAVEFWRRKRA